MNDTQALLEQIGKHWGWEVGNKVKQEISAVVGATNIDLVQLQNAIATIQGMLDANPNTAQFDVGQNIITQLAQHLTQITALETSVTKLNGGVSVVGSVAYAVKQESDRAVLAESGLQSAIDAEALARQNGDNALQAQIDTLTAGSSSSIAGVQAELDATQAGAGLNADGTYSANAGANYIANATSLKDADDKLDGAIKVVETATATAQATADANTASLATLNGDATVVGSVANIAEGIATTAGAGAVGTAKAYADATFVTKADVTAIDAVALASMFRQAMDCGFGGATITDVINGTGACASATPTTPTGGTGAVI